MIVASGKDMVIGTTVPPLWLGVQQATIMREVFVFQSANTIQIPAAYPTRNVLSWYYKEIGDRTYEQLKDENSQFIQRYTRALKRQAKALPANTIFTEDYYPSIENLSVP